MLSNKAYKILKPKQYINKKSRKKPILEASKLFSQFKELFLDLQVNGKIIATPTEDQLNENFKYFLSQNNHFADKEQFFDNFKENVEFFLIKNYNSDYKEDDNQFLMRRKISVSPFIQHCLNRYT